MSAFKLSTKVWSDVANEVTDKPSMVVAPSTFRPSSSVVPSTSKVLPKVAAPSTFNVP